MGDAEDAVDAAASPLEVYCPVVCFQAVCCLEVLYPVVYCQEVYCQEVSHPVALVGPAV